MTAQQQPKSTGRSSNKLKRRQTYSTDNNPMLRDEEANLELMKPPMVPEELKDFLREIAFPPEEEEDDRSSHYKDFKVSLKGVKSRVDTGSFKGRKDRRKSADGSVASDNGSKGEDEDEWSESEETVAIKKKEFKFSEYEMAVLWSQYKDKFPGGKMNNVQLSQMLRQVFPRCDHEHLEHVVENIRHIFDPQDTGVISFRDLLITFSLSMKGPLKDRLQWSYRLYDVEGNGRIDRDDLVDTITRLCQITKNANAYWRNKRNGRKVAEEQKPVTPTAVKKTTKFGEEEHSHSGKARKARGIEEDIGNLKILSNRMGERVGASKQMRKKHHHHEVPPSPSAPEDKTEEKFSYTVASLDEVEKKRAFEVVQYLDANGDGYVTQEEFVQGCLEDEEFFGIASSFHGQLIWGELL